MAPGAVGTTTLRETGNAMYWRPPFSTLAASRFESTASDSVQAPLNVGSSIQSKWGVATDV